MHQRGVKSEEKQVRDQRLTIRFGADSGWDEGTNRNITGADGILLVNAEMRSAGIDSASGQGRIIVRTFIGLWRRHCKVWLCVCGRRLNKNR